MVTVKIKSPFTKGILLKIIKKQKGIARKESASSFGIEEKYSELYYDDLTIAD